MAIGSEFMTNSLEKHVARLAQSKGYCRTTVDLHREQGRRFADTGIPDSEFSFSLEEAEVWLVKKEKYDTDQRLSRFRRCRRSLDPDSLTDGVVPRTWVNPSRSKDGDPTRRAK